MSDDSSAVSSLSLSKPKTRGRVLALLGAGGGAALASLFSRNGAMAGHDGTNVMHLSELNNAPNAAPTVLITGGDDDAFRVDNNSPGTSAAGVHATSRGPKATIAGEALGGGIGVMGNVGSGPTFGQGPGTGVQGIGDSGHGVRGQSTSGIGVEGHNQSGNGGVFTTVSGTALLTNGPAKVTVDRDDFALGVHNPNTGDQAGGILVTAFGNHGAVMAELLEGTGVAVQGSSGGDGDGPGVGVRGMSGTGIGVDALSPDGIALNVAGKAMFSTAGSAVIPAGQSSAFVANAAVTGDSHVSVTLVGDPGSRQVRWVERSPGTGFTVHLSSAPPPARPATPLTYLVVEPG